jgi:hypothetical protein
MPTHDDLLLEGHDEGRDGQGLCPNCQEPIESAETGDGSQCICCPICEGDGRVLYQTMSQICPACNGWGILQPKDEVIAADLEKPL